MSDDQLDVDTVPAPEQVLKIERVSGRYASNLGLAKNDIIAGIDGTPFLAGIEAFKDFFQFDGEEDHEEARVVLTIKRADAFFNLICYHKIICKFSLVDNPDPEPSIELQKTLKNAQDEFLLDYIVFHDNHKNVEFLLRGKSLTAMVAPPLWLLNQRVPEAALASLLAGVVAFVVHPLLGALYYALLCIYIGRDQSNLAMVFMNYRRLIHYQSLAATSELEAQRTLLELDPDFHIQNPAEGLEKQPRRTGNKKPIHNSITDKAQVS